MHSSALFALLTYQILISMVKTKPFIKTLKFQDICRLMGGGGGGGGGDRERKKERFKACFFARIINTFKRGFTDLQVYKRSVWRKISWTIMANFLISF